MSQRATIPEKVVTMTNHVARLYALAISLIVFFAVWLAVSTHPWPQSTSKASAPAVNPQLARLPARERHLRAETRRVNLIVNRRYAAYRRALVRRNHANATARVHHNQQLAAAHRAALAVTRVASAPAYSGAVAAPAAVRVVTLPAVAATRTS
jgi:hypothetical protein